MNSNRNYLFAVMLVLCSSTATYFISTSSAQPGAKPQPIADNQYQAGGTLYMQKAAEYRALAYQAYNMARWQLDLDLAGKNKKEIAKVDRKKPRAVIVDIDETVLDNSPYQALNITLHRAYERNGWHAWTALRKAKAVPGAVDFLNYAISKGVKVYFISNRDETPEKEPTVENLRSVGIKDISADNVLLRGLGSDGKLFSPKGPRRETVSAKYRVVLLVGDNLDDLSSVFEKAPLAERFAAADTNRELWGKRWIVLPNAMYGTWESAIYGYKSLSDAEKAKVRLEALELP